MTGIRPGPGSWRRALVGSMSPAERLRNAVRLDEAGARRRRRKLGGKRGVGFAGIRRARRDIAERRDFAINPSLADDGSRPGMSYEHRRPVLQRKDAARGRDVVRKRRQRVLHRGGAEAKLL